MIHKKKKNNNQGVFLELLVAAKNVAQHAASDLLLNFLDKVIYSKVAINETIGRYL